MQSSVSQCRRLAQAAGCVLALCGVTSAEAASAAGTATATVVAPAVVVIVVPPVFLGTVVTIESYTNSLSSAGPVLRAASPPPATSDAAGTEGGNGGAAQGAPTLQGAAGPGMVPPGAGVAAVTVTRKADGALAVSGGSTLTFSVSEPGGAGTITIEYN